MKRFFLLPLLLCSTMFALPIGNPMDPALYSHGLYCDDCCYEQCCNPCDPCFSWCDAFSVRLGFYGDYVFNKHMEIDGPNSKDVDNFEIYTNAGIVTLNFCGWLDIFSTWGASNIVIGADDVVFGSAAHERAHIETETSFSYSIGARVAFWECDCFTFGAEGQYFATKPNVRLYDRGTRDIVHPDSNIEMRYSEWQVGVGAAYLMQIGCSGISAVPYLGVKYGHANADSDDGFLLDNAFLYDIESKNGWGYAIGTTLLFCEAVSLSVEGRFADETAVHVNGQFRF